MQAENHKIVLLEPDPSRRGYLKSLMAGWGYQPFIFERESICLDNLPPLDPDLVISGSIDADKTLHFIHSLKLLKQNLPIVSFTADDTLRSYADANGFCDIQLLKLNDLPETIQSAIYRSLDTGCRRNAVPDPVVIGTSPAIVKTKSLIPKINQCQDPVLIQGESGVGKELFAWAIHRHSERNKNSFTRVNSIKLPYQLLEVELFGPFGSRVSGIGARKGSGLFAAADKGTFFIKEIDAMPLDLQARMLHIIEDLANYDGQKQEKIPIDVRIIASTTRDLTQLTSEGKFRKDLFYRLNVLPIRIPTLRARGEDIPALADFFSYRFSFEFGRSYFRLSRKTKQNLCRYSWPGNVKELAEVIRQAVICGSDEIIMQHIKLKYAAIQNANRRRKTDFPIAANLLNLRAFLQESENYDLKLFRREFQIRTEKTLLKKALKASNWNRKKAAAMLNISYKSFLDKMKNLNIT